MFGNKVTVATFAEAADTLTVTNRLSVEQTAPEWPVFRIAVDALSYPFSYSAEDNVDLGALRATSGRVADDAVTTWARGFPRGDTTDTLSLLKDINAAIVRQVSYRVREEEGTQSPAETLTMRSGSCRDIAALFIETVRVLGFGARAASGYLYDPEASTAPGSTHAWAEVYLPEAGWITFDPTHARVGSANLITTAVGRHNSQIMPILGSFSGTADDFVSMDVAVTVSIV